MALARNSNRATLDTIQGILLYHNHVASNLYLFKEEIHRDSRDAFIRIQARKRQGNRTHNVPTTAEISVVMQIDGKTKVVIL